MNDFIEILQDVVEHIGTQSTDKIYQESGNIQSAKEGVLSRFQPIFMPDNIENISAEDYLAFLQFENNNHWTGLYRKGNAVAGDMQSLRVKLKILVDESISISQRYNETNLIDGLGKGIITAILQVVYPNTYGVWNNRVEKGMKAFKLWPVFPRGISEGEKYEILNNRLKKIADKLEIDLWTLDSLWWVISEKGIKAFSATETLDEENEFPEGKAVFRTHKYYERNSSLIQKKKILALNEGTLVCSVCDFDFHKIYGEIGEGFIECHHTIPVSEYSSETKTKLQDLALVCSNCHRMLHRKRPCLTVEQMREIVHCNK